MIGVNLVVCNRTPRHRRATEVALASLLQSDLTAAPYRLVIVDNGSSDDTGAWLTHWVRTHAVSGVVLALGANRGIAAGRNVGYRALLAQPEVWAVAEVHNDMVFPSRWVAPLRATLEADPTVGLASASLMTPRGTLGAPRVHVDYAWPMARIIAVVNEQAATLRRPWRRPGLQHPVLKRVAMLRQIGLYDEAFAGANYEDTDELYRASAAGWQYVVVGEAVVWHHYTLSRMTVLPDHDRLYHENRQRFLRKHPDAGAFLQRYARETAAIYR